MKLKVKTALEHGAWRYFEADEVQVERGLPKDFEKVSGVEYYAFDQGKENWPCITISFFAPNGVPKEIFTNLEVYLLNDAGQTMEKLN